MTLSLYEIDDAIWVIPTRKLVHAATPPIPIELVGDTASDGGRKEGRSDETTKRKHAVEVELSRL